MGGNLACGICDASFSGVMDRRSHLIVRHGIASNNLTEYLLFPFRCHECRRLVTSFDLLCTHLEKTHGIHQDPQDPGLDVMSEDRPGPTLIDALYNGYDEIELDELLRNTLQRSRSVNQ